MGLRVLDGHYGSDYYLFELQRSSLSYTLSLVGGIVRHSKTEMWDYFEHLMEI